jgi:capsular polysaccharide biosynthesis protein
MIPDPGTLPKLTNLKSVYEHMERNHHIVKKEEAQPFKAFWVKASSAESVPQLQAESSPLSMLVTKSHLRQEMDNSGAMDMLHSSATVTYEAQLPGAYIEGNNVQHGGLLFDSEVSFGPMANGDNFFGGLPTTKNAEVVHLGARVLALPFKWSFAFQCFTTDTLPRLVYALDSLRADPELKVLIEGTPVQLEYMDILALDRSRVVTFEPHKAYTASQVSTVLYDWFSYEFMPREAAARFYKEVALRTHPERPCGDRNLVIYVKRPAGGARSVSNEAELIQSLRTLSAFKHGLELQVYDGNAAVKDAIALFQRAVLVIGAHGGGMANLMFSPPGTLVVEISTPGTYSYAAPAIACQQEYWLVLAKSDADSDAHNKPMTVNINEVTALVGCALSHHADVHTGLSPLMRLDESTRPVEPAFGSQRRRRSVGSTRGLRLICNWARISGQRQSSH